MHSLTCGLDGSPLSRLGEADDLPWPEVGICLLSAEAAASEAAGVDEVLATASVSAGSASAVDAADSASALALMVRWMVTVSAAATAAAAAASRTDDVALQNWSTNLQRPSPRAAYLTTTWDNAREASSLDAEKPQPSQIT